MNKVSDSASRLLVDLEGGVRRISRDVGLGVIEALREKPMVDEAPAPRAEQLALGFLRGVDEGLADDHLRRSLSDAIAIAVERALTTALARSPELLAISEDVARAFARGVLSELRVQLGEEGEGALTRSLGASTQKVVREGSSALRTPLVVLAALVLVAVAAGVGIMGAIFLRRT